MKSIAIIITLLFGSVMVIAQTTPAICIATVDPGTNYNMVGWDKAAFPASSYNIYQETSPGFYTIIGNTPTGSLSVYFDISSDPDLGSSSYKITTLDGVGGESAQSAAFTTMFLSTLLSGSTVSMFWSPPGGFVPVQYYIWRGATSSTMTLIDSMPVTSYVDISPALGTTCYKIEAPNPAGCVPTAPPTSYNSSFSNTACATVMSIAGPDQAGWEVDVTPNPFRSTAIFTIDGTSQSVDFELYNLIGKKVQALYNISGPTFEVSRENLPDGIYLYRITGYSGLLDIGKVIVN